MVIVRIIGGLGNQMFQYAAGLALARRLNTRLILDLYDMKFYKIFNFGLDKLKIDTECLEYSMPLKWYSFIVRSDHWVVRLIKLIYPSSRNILFKCQIFSERSFRYDGRWPYLKNNIFIKGYFQSDLYFKEIRNELLQKFQPVEDLNNINIKWLQQMKGNNSVALHIRRGDYLSNANVQIHGVCSLDYYMNAIKYIKSKIVNPKFFIFSDDIAWAKSNIKIDEQITFIDGNPPENDIFLMSMCSNHIISNSSFSWWGAWLSKGQDQIVIAPQPWFNTSTLTESDLIPSNWIRMAKN